MSPRGRDALVGVCFLAVVAAAVSATLRRNRAPELGFTVERCLLNISDCRAKPYLDLLGVYVPGSQVWGETGCAMQLELQAPHGTPPGRIRICAERAGPKLEAPATNHDLLVHAQGNFSGDHFDARLLLPVAYAPAR